MGFTIVRFPLEIKPSRTLADFGGVSRYTAFLVSCYEVTFVKGAEKFSQKLDRPSNFNPDSTWKEL